MLIPQITEFLIFFFQCTGMLIEGFFLFIMFRFKGLRKRSSLRLIQYLVATDMTCAVLGIPYVLYILNGWNQSSMDFDPLTILLLSAVTDFCQKVNVILTVSIALDRALALYFPIYYRYRNHKRFCLYCLAAALLAGGIDIYLDLHLATLQRHPGCPTVGCFMADEYLTIYGFSNLGYAIIKIVLTGAILLKLRMMAAKPFEGGNNEKNKFQQANRVTIGVLAVSLTFTTAPSMLVTAAGMFNWTIFSKIGPFFFLNHIIAGNLTPIVYLLWHANIRRTAGQVTTFASSTSVVTITS